MNDRSPDWSDLRVFAAIAELGSLTAAGQALGISQPTAGRALARLEARLGARLFERGRTGLALTGGGARLLPAVRRMDVAAADALRAAGVPDDAPLTVRISAGDWGSWFLARNLDAILVDGVRIELTTQDRLVDVGRGEANLALRNRRPENSALVGVDLGPRPYAAFASPDFLDRHPHAADPARWPDLQWAAYTEDRGNLPSARWLAALLDGREPFCRVNRSPHLMPIVQAGLAIAVMPVWAVAPSMGLVQVGEPIAGIRNNAWLVYHPDLRFNPRLRRVKDRLVRLLKRR